MIASSINLSPDVQAQITSFAAQYGVDALVVSAIAQVSSGGQQFYSDGSLVVTPYGVGVMGISKSIATSLGLDATEQVTNIQAGVSWFAGLLQAFVGNYPLAIAGYVTSVSTVRQFNGIPPLAPVNNFVYNVTKIAENAGSPSVSSVVTLTYESTVDPTSYASATGELVDSRAKGNDYLKNPATSAKNLTELQATMEPILQTPDDSLGATPWYNDTGLVTGNKNIRNSVQPVSFTVFFDRNDPNQMLRDGATQTNKPIEIQLNTSLSSFEITSKHIYNRTPSRTGMHITLWGMELDLINGSGTTGVFMNQFGLTDFMSTAGVSQDIINLLSGGLQKTFERTFNPTTTSVAVPSSSVIGSDLDVAVVTDSQTTTGQVFSTAVTGDQGTLNTVAGQRIAKLNLSNPSEAFRVAAQDAFVELLKLFQMNGNIWFHSQSYANGTNLGTIGQTQQEAPTAWSRKAGATSFQQHARNNDVMTRGYVAMRFKNNVYLGYFKTLSWTQDAESPFQWKFNFTFQVEKTYTALYFSQPKFVTNAPSPIPISIAPPPPPTGG
jgi:hypothetical protein